MSAAGIHAGSAAGSVEVVNPKIWAQDLASIKSSPSTADTEGYLRRVRLAAQNRQPGDPMRPFIVRTAEILVSILRRDGRGIARARFSDLARGVGCCVETARKAVRFLERVDLLDTFNILTRSSARRGGPVGTWRDANCYVLPDPPASIDAGAVPVPAERPASDLASRIAARLARHAQSFGLAARTWGYNATAAFAGVRPNPRMTPTS